MSKQPRKTLVTSGTSFIGSHLVDRLLADGHEVVVLDGVGPLLRDRCNTASTTNSPRSEWGLRPRIKWSSRRWTCKSG